MDSEEKDEEVRFTLRLPKELHAALEADAKLEDRSLNMLVVTRLKASLRTPMKRKKR